MYLLPEVSAQRKSQFRRILSVILMISEDVKDHFWAVVRECLIQFHGKALEIEFFRKGVKDDLFYHNEPFGIACRIAKNPLAVENYIERYIQIRDVELSYLLK